MRNTFTSYGDYFDIDLTFKGKTFQTHVGLLDFQKVQSISGTWGMKWNPTAHTFYVRWQTGGRKHRRIVYLHRYILDVVDEPSIEVDHDDHNGLNNMRINLVISDKQKNGFNRRGAERGSKSGRRNVYWNAREQKWMVWLVCMRRRYYVGYFADIEKADEAAKSLRISLGGKA